MMDRPEPDAGFLDLKLSPKLLLGLMIGGDTKANRVSAERIPLAAAYILKHYSHVTIKPDRLTMRDVIGIEARRWDKHLPAADIDLLVNILWDKGYTLGQKLGPSKWKDPLSAKYARAADENRGLVISRPLSPMEELLGVAAAVLPHHGPIIQLALEFGDAGKEQGQLSDAFIEGEVIKMAPPSPSFDIGKA